MKILLIITCISASLFTFTAFGMDVSKYAHATHLLVKLPEDRVTFTNEPEWFKQKSFTEKKQVLLSLFPGLQYEGADGDQRLTADCAQIPFLQNQQPTSITQRLLTQGLPLAAVFGLGYLVAKKMNAAE